MEGESEPRPVDDDDDRCSAPGADCTHGEDSQPQVPERPRPPRQHPAAYKLRILGEYEQLDKAGKGALLRREGFYASLISEWCKQRDKGALAALGEGQRRGRPPRDPRE